MKKAEIGVIGGTGVYALEGLEIIEKIYPDTPWGKPSDEITIAAYTNGEKTLRIAFLPRHGKGHFITPSNIPQKANLAALKMLGVEEIIAFSAVGSLKEEIAPGHFVLPTQIIDRTRHRQDTYFDGSIVAHVSLADPFSKGLADILAESARVSGVTLHREETLICMEGPSFSTRAESKLYKSWGAGIINMSVLPEARLARELEMCYQMVCMSTDYDAWREEEEAVEVDSVMAVVKTNSGKAQEILRNALPLLAQKHPLPGPAKKALSFGIMTNPEKQKPEDREKMKQVLPHYFA